MEWVNFTLGFVLGTNLLYKVVKGLAALAQADRFCRPLAILIELNRHAAVHGEQPLASLAADSELAATLQPIIPLREPGPRLEA